MGMQPTLQVVVAGYAASFAEEWGAKARDVLELYGRQFFGVSLRASSKAKAHWNLEHLSGGMFALGVGGQLTGRGADVLVIDDPFKNSEEADSEVMQLKTGIHLGRPRRIGDDYLGVDVNIAARLLEAAKPGEILISDRTLQALDPAMVTATKRPFSALGVPTSLGAYVVERADLAAVTP
jgi:hypothetical protein